MEDKPLLEPTENGRLPLARRRSPYMNDMIMKDNF